MHIYNNPSNIRLGIHAGPIFLLHMTSFRIIGRHFGWFCRLLLAVYSEVVVSVYYFIVAFRVLYVIILSFLAR